FEAIALPKPDHVEPVASPPLAVAGGSEQAVDECCVSSLTDELPVAGIVGAGSNEIGHLLRRWWQTCQIEGDSPNQRSRTGGRRRLEAVLTECAVNELVDQALLPGPGCRGIDHWKRAFEGLQRPPVVAGAVV